jgi:hypothetical protein
VPASGGNSGNTSNVAIADDGSGRVEEKALQMAIEEVWEESGRRHRPWAANGRATRMGEVLLLVDSDTIVPEVGFGFGFEGERGSMVFMCG